MSLHTPIEWCDSAVNPVMGCDGCELWDPSHDVFICYAGQIHRTRAGRPGYADEFLVPKTFAGRMAAAARWRDLRGTARPDKPWLDGMPRIVFISDMGDALSESVPFEFLRDEVVHTVAAWPHIGMWLTKQPQRMAAFASWLREQGIAWPANLWAGTSITGPGQGARVRHLKRVGAATTFLSVEPVLRDPGELDLTGIGGVILGGASGPKSPPTEIGHLRAMVRRAREANCKVFVKQLGARPIASAHAAGLDVEQQLPAGGRMRLRVLSIESATELQLDDKKGGDLDEIRRVAPDLALREMPRAA